MKYDLQPAPTSAHIYTIIGSNKMKQQIKIKGELICRQGFRHFDYKHFTKQDVNKLKPGNPHIYKPNMHITSNSKSFLNEGRPNERKDEENSYKLAVLTV